MPGSAPDTRLWSRRSSACCQRQGPGQGQGPGGMGGGQPPQKQGGSWGVVPPRLIEPLSQSEIRVLRYLPTNLSGREIARELSVSLNTVRTHMRHIFAKLGVHRRTEAVTRARALGLLAPSPRAP